VADLKVESVWFNVYLGGAGTAPYAQHLYIDEVRISEQPLLRAGAEAASVGGAGFFVSPDETAEEVDSPRVDSSVGDAIIPTRTETVRRTTFAVSQATESVDALLGSYGTEQPGVTMGSPVATYSAFELAVSEELARDYAVQYAI
jgi:hypothetical protein